MLSITFFIILTPQSFLTNTPPPQPPVWRSLPQGISRSLSLELRGGQQIGPSKLTTSENTVLSKLETLNNLSKGPRKPIQEQEFAVQKQVYASSETSSWATNYTPLPTDTQIPALMAMGCPSDIPSLLYPPSTVSTDCGKSMDPSLTTLPTVTNGGGGGGGGGGLSFDYPSLDPSPDYAKNTLQDRQHMEVTCTAAGGEEGICFDTAHTWALGYELSGAMGLGDEVQGTDEVGDTVDLSEMPLFEHVQAAVKHDPEYRARFMRHKYSKVLRIVAFI